MLTTLPPSCVDYLEIWEHHNPKAFPVQAFTRIALPLPFFRDSVLHYIAFLISETTHLILVTFVNGCLHCNLRDEF
jgi:hypothetical protein